MGIAATTHSRKLYRRLPPLINNSNPNFQTQIRPNTLPLLKLSGESRGFFLLSAAVDQRHGSAVGRQQEAIAVADLQQPPLPTAYNSNSRALPLLLSRSIQATAASSLLLLGRRRRREAEAILGSPPFFTRWDGQQQGVITAAVLLQTPPAQQQQHRVGAAASDPSVLTESVQPSTLLTREARSRHNKGKKNRFFCFFLELPFYLFLCSFDLYVLQIMPHREIVYL